MADLIAHGLCSDASSGSLEIDVARSANARVERVTPRRNEVCHASADDDELQITALLSKNRRTSGYEYGLAELCWLK